MRLVPWCVLAVTIGSVAAVAPETLAQGNATTAVQAPVTQVQTARDLAAVCDPTGIGVPRLEAIAYCQGFLTSFGQYHALLYPRNGPARPLLNHGRRWRTGHDADPDRLPRHHAHLPNKTQTEIVA